ncbi:hypothetical protein NHX12_008929, partial [Muraenolepis orangiensis]
MLASEVWLFHVCLRLASGAAVKGFLSSGPYRPSSTTDPLVRTVDPPFKGDTPLPWGPTGGTQGWLAAPGSFHHLHNPTSARPAEPIRGRRRELRRMGLLADPFMESWAVTLDQDGPRDGLVQCGTDQLVHSGTDWSTTGRTGPSRDGLVHHGMVWSTTGQSGPLQDGPTGPPQYGPTGPPRDGPTGLPQDGPTGLPQDGPSVLPQDGPTGPLRDGPTGPPWDGPAGPPRDGPTGPPQNGLVHHRTVWSTTGRSGPPQNGLVHHRTVWSNTGRSGPPRDGLVNHGTVWSTTGWTNWSTAGQTGPLQDGPTGPPRDGHSRTRQMFH